MPDLTAKKPLSARMDHTVERAEEIIRRYQPGTFLEAGCGSGRLVQALRERGIEAYGFDASANAIAQAPDRVRTYLWVGTPADPVPDHYDLIACTGVLDDTLTDLGAITGATKQILLASPCESAAGLLAEAGFFRDLSDPAALTAPSALYRRDPTMTPAALVRAYEQALDGVRRDRNELERLRAREERATEAMTQSLRLRDLLIVSERAVGQVKGEVTYLQDQLHGYEELTEYHRAVMASTTWRIGNKAMGPYRRILRLLGK